MVTVFTLDRAGDARSMAGLPRVACAPFVSDREPVTPSPWDHLSVVADAYAGSARELDSALRFVLSEDRAGRLRGPLRVTWLGALGTGHPAGSPPIGTSLQVVPGFTIGRLEGSALCLRQGAHSDQNMVARRHAELSPTAHGVRVRDLGSTNGTWLRGVRVKECDLLPGEELVMAGVMHVRLDGAAP